MFFESSDKVMVMVEVPHPVTDELVATSKVWKEKGLLTFFNSIDPVPCVTGVLKVIVKLVVGETLVAPSTGVRDDLEGTAAVNFS